MATSRAFAAEDGQLGAQTLITTRTKDYKDLDLSFVARPDGDIYRKNDAAAVKQAVKNLIMTGLNEKPFKKSFGGGLGDILFEPMDELTAFNADINIRAAIKAFEPRAVIANIDVQANPDRNSLDVRVKFGVINTSEVITLETSLSRLR
jgi:phage baseplate assembly protein W